MNYWSVRDLRFFHHFTTRSLQRRAASCRFLVWRLCLDARLKRAFFIPCKKLDLLKPSIPLLRSTRGTSETHTFFFVTRSISRRNSKRERTKPAPAICRSRS